MKIVNESIDTKMSSSLRCCNAR